MELQDGTNKRSVSEPRHTRGLCEDYRAVQLLSAANNLHLELIHLNLQKIQIQIAMLFL